GAARRAGADGQGDGAGAGPVGTRMAGPAKHGRGPGRRTVPVHGAVRRPTARVHRHQPDPGRHRRGGPGDCRSAASPRQSCRAGIRPGDLRRHGRHGGRRGRPGQRSRGERQAGRSRAATDAAVTMDFHPRPAPGQAKPWTFPVPERGALANGLTVLRCHRPGQQVVAVQICLDMPLDAEPDGLDGIAAIMMSALSEGTSNHTAEEFAAEMERCGATLDASAGYPGARVSLEVPVSRLPRALVLLAAPLGGWPGGAAEPAPMPPVTTDDTGRVVIVDRPDAVQTQLLIGRTGPDRHDRVWPALVLGTYCLGGTLTSRLDRVLREEKGYTYGVRAFQRVLRSLAPHAAERATGVSVLAISGSVDTASTGPALDDVWKVLRLLAAEGLT